MNPFITRGYRGSKFFCDREKEVDQIIRAIHNERDVTLVSLRKMGKTGLIYRVFELLQQEGVYEPLYVDIYHTEQLNGLINQLASALFRLKKSFGGKVRDFLDHFRYVRPVMALDPLTGMPSVSFDIHSEKVAFQTLEELFSMIVLRSKKRPVVVAIDEFQQIASYPERSVEAMFRGLIQDMEHVRFVFSGSNKTILTRMFGDHTQPFYQSTEMMYLSEIDEASYEAFIQAHFNKPGKKIDPGVIGQLLTWCRRHTWYVQFVCNRLYDSDTMVSANLLHQIQQEILVSREPFYLEYRNLLTRHQWQLLRAISRMNEQEKITSAGFIQTHGLTNASTVRRGVEALLDKEMIYQKEDRYFVYDPFFARWME